jgi:hypothetical protein
MNLMVCKLGTTKGTATVGDVVIIPSTQVMEGSDMSFPLPATHALSVPTLLDDA